MRRYNRQNINQESGGKKNKNKNKTSDRSLNILLGHQERGRGLKNVGRINSSRQVLKPKSAGRSRSHVPFRTKLAEHIVLGAHRIRRQTTDPVCTIPDIMQLCVGQAGSVTADATCIAGSFRIPEPRRRCKVQVCEGPRLAQCMPETNGVSMGREIKGSKELTG